MSSSTLTFGKRVAQKRKALGMTQETLANLIGESWTFLNDIEHDRIDPNQPDVLAKLASALHIQESELTTFANQHARDAELRQLELTNDKMAMISFRRSRTRE